MTNTKVKQTNKVELEWKAAKDGLEVHAEITDGTVSSVTILSRYPDKGRQSSFSVYCSKGLNDLLEGLQTIRDEVAERLKE